MSCLKEEKFAWKEGIERTPFIRFVFGFGFEKICNFMLHFNKGLLEADFLKKLKVTI